MAIAYGKTQGDKRGTTVCRRVALHDVEFDRLMKGYPDQLLSREEEQRIGLLPSDHPDRWKLVIHNIKFMILYTRRFAKKHGHIIDGPSLLGAVQDGMISASKKFDTDKSGGCRFISFCVNNMHWACRNELAKQQAPVRMPVWGKDTEHRFLEDGRYYAFIEPRRFDEHFDEIMQEAKETREDASAPDQEVMEHDLKADLLHELNNLSSKGQLDLRAQMIVRKNFGLDGEKPAMLSELAAELGISKQRVRQIRENALRKLRSNKLRQHL